MSQSSKNLFIQDPVNCSIKGRLKRLTDACGRRFAELYSVVVKCTMVNS